MSERTRLDIENILRTEIETARARLDLAKQKLEETMRNPPTGFPAPEGAPHIHQIRSERRDALDAARQALSRFNDFVLNGVRPEGV